MGLFDVLHDKIFLLSPSRKRRRAKRAAAALANAAQKANAEEASEMGKEVAVDVADYATATIAEIGDYEVQHHKVLFLRLMVLTTPWRQFMKQKKLLITR